MKNTTTRSTASECTARETKYILFKMLCGKMNFVTAIIPHDNKVGYTIVYSTEHEDAIELNSDMADEAVIMFGLTEIGLGA